MHFFKTLTVAVATLVATVVASPIANADSELVKRGSHWQKVQCHPFGVLDHAIGTVSILYPELCTEMVGTSTHLAAGHKLTALISEHMTEPIQGQLRFYAGIYSKGKKGIDITHAQCVGILNHIQSQCIDRSLVEATTAGGTVVSTDGNLRVNLKFSFTE